MSSSRFDKIIKLIRKGKVSLFIGAGFSLKAGAPSAQSIINELLKDLTKDQKEELSNKPTLQQVANLYETYFSREKLINKLQQLFAFAPTDTTDQDDVVKVPQIKSIFTTNYDSLLENAYDGQCNVVVKDTDIIKIDNSLPTIYKIHGDFSHTERIIISDDDYTEFYTKHSQQVLWQKICSELAQRSIVFIGYSLSDSNIKFIIDNLQKKMGDKANEMFLICPSINKSNRIYLQKKRITYIEAYADDLFCELIPAIRDNATHDFRQHRLSAEDFTAVMNLYDIQPQTEIKGKDKQNIIGHLNSVSGNPLEHKLSFTFNGLPSQNPLAQIPTSYNKNGIPFKDISYTTFRHVVNDVVIDTEQDIKSLYIYPSQQDIQIKFYKSWNNTYSIKGRYYSNFDTSDVVIFADMVIGKLTITLPTQEGCNLSFKIEFFDEYKDNDIAIKEAQYLLSFIKGEKMKVYLLAVGKKELCKTLNQKQNNLALQEAAEKRLQYYQYIKDIEKKRRERFDIYKNFDIQNYHKVMYVRNYLYQNPTAIDNSPNLRLTFTTTDDAFSPDKKNKYLALNEIKNMKVVVNNIEFEIPYLIIQRLGCKFISRKKVKDGWEMTYIDESPKYYVICKDEPMKIQPTKITI